ncbi:right-handed parallel beta-helix repeat-containing protein [Microvirga terrestris]|uniref:Right-handed parallel beta-helix repeat-containing protein n=1 Tax=Microvirga terrestris TaxID=2791024 RepID=A0ABS0HUJ6_9HYPH|nr:right-handed parallel beta-helix repeat-containing protein [Microvirga terrestris]MBF9197173.1 right-handed parallel beta-helix repeat-containing protein [Microvirga terrestris]
MTASSRSDGRRRLRVAFLLLSMVLTSSAMAQGGNEVSRLADEARQAFLSAEQNGVNLKQKAGFYQVARARVRLLEKFASHDNAGSAELRDGARAELMRLADDGLSHDMLSSFLLQSSLSDLAGASTAADRVEVGVSLHQIAGDQRSPAYRSAAFVDLAHAYAKAGAQDRALRYASLAMEAADRVPEPGTRGGAYKAAARVAVGLGPSGLNLADRAVTRIPQSRDRAYARHELARIQLKGSAWEKATDPRLIAEAKRRLEAGDLPGCALMALSLLDSKARDDLLSSLIDASISRQEDRVALMAAQGIINSSSQDKAIGALVRYYVDRGTALQAAEMLNAMQDSLGKVSIQLKLAADLKKLGYGDMANQLLSASIRQIETYGEATQRAASADLVRALTRSGRLDEALGYARRTESNTEGSAVLVELVKELADRGRMPEAEGLLPRLLDKDHRSHALSEIGRAKAKAGDTAGAMQIIPELVGTKDAGRVLASIASAYSRSGNFGQAMSVAGQIEDVEYRLAALSEVARQAKQHNNKEVSNRALNDVVRTAESLEAGTRDNMLLNIIRSFTPEMNRAQADELAGRVADAGLRVRAEQLIFGADVRDLIKKKRRGEIPDALLVRGIKKIEVDEDKAELALELATLLEGGIRAADLIRTIRDGRLRRATFRRLAEAQADVLRKPLEEEPNSSVVQDVQTVASAPEEPEETVQEIQTRRGLLLIRGDAGDAKSAVDQLPRSFVTAADARAETPWPADAVVGSTFANHNPYIAKFFEDDEQGNTRLEQAIRHQGMPSPRVIVVQSGIATLGMVARKLQGGDARDLIAYSAEAVTVRAPIFVAPGATLVLSRLDSPVYRLSASAGAFIVNAGNVHIVDAEVVGYDEASRRPLWAEADTSTIFRPFLLTWGDGRMNVASSTLVALGYDNAKSFGLSYSSGPERVAELRDQSRPTGVIVDSIFENLHFGFHSYEAEGIQVVGNEFRDSVGYGLDAHDRTHGSIVALNTVYGTKQRHGITVSREADDGLIVGNMTFENVGSGIVIDRNSSNNIVHANSSFRNDQDGVTIFESSCNVLTSNYLAGNRRDGLKVRNSIDVGAYSNRIEANANSGVSAYIADLMTQKGAGSPIPHPASYLPLTSLSLRHNRFSANGVGINAQGVSSLAMSSNRFVKQSRRLLGGDIRGLEGQILRLTSQSNVLVASTCRPAKPVSVCRLRDRGYFEGESELQVFRPQGGSDCTDVNGSVQHRAFSSTPQGT